MHLVRDVSDPKPKHHIKFQVVVIQAEKKVTKIWYLTMLCQKINLIVKQEVDDMNSVCDA